MKAKNLLLLLIFCVYIALSGGSAFANGSHARRAKVSIDDKKVSVAGAYSGYSKPTYQGNNYHSYYIPMRDSVLLAADVFLPNKVKKGEQIPTILYLTRYVRSIRPVFPISIFKRAFLTVVNEDEVKFFNAHGYACIIVDVRGTGASLGGREMEFSPTEILDGKDVVNWITAQPWSDKKVGVTGVSYLGTTAEMLLVNQHPAVKACITRSGIFDLYGHVVFPGGVCQGPFVKKWGHTTNSLDHNDFDEFGKRAKLVKGINHVMGDKGRNNYSEALERHRGNFDVARGIQEIRFRDETNKLLTIATDSFSVHNFRQAIEGSKTPIYRMSGWYDGALSKSCLEGYQQTSNTERVLIGPWDHGLHDNASPFANGPEVTFDFNKEMLRFFDYHIKGIKNGIDNDPAVRYFTIGEEDWNTANQWPPRHQTTEVYYLSADRSLSADSNKVVHNALPYKIDYAATSGNTSRWNSLVPHTRNGNTHYSDRREEDKKLLYFTTAETSKAIEITGQAVVELELMADAGDAHIFAYLEDVGPDSSVTYITEGMFRPVHRKLDVPAAEVCNACPVSIPHHSYKMKDAVAITANEAFTVSFDLLPISYLLKKGHQLRIAFAGADATHFDEPEPKPTQLTIFCNNARNARLLLPVIEK
jgi:putative CocE/NonD family hydrolase